LTHFASESAHDRHLAALPAPAPTLLAARPPGAAGGLQPALAALLNRFFATPLREGALDSWTGG